MNKKHLIIAVVSTIGISLSGKEMLDREALYLFLNDTNPYVFTAIADQLIQEKRITYAKGEFDTKLGAKYEEKQYPKSTAHFNDLYVEKPMENGMEWLAGYRQADGTQEYNNIKTSSDGEARIGLKVPINALLQGSNQRQLNVSLATLNSLQAASSTEKNLRELYFSIFASYYRLLMQQELMLLEKELLKNAQQRYAFITTQVDIGDLPRIALVESKQIIVDREQRMAESTNAFMIARQQLLAYLNITEEHFDQNFEIPRLKDFEVKAVTVETAYAKMIKNRPELEILQYETDKLKEERKFTSLMKYPQFDAAVYGVHDLQYNNGVKFSLEMAFPIEQRKFEGKRSEIQLKKEKNDHEVKKALLEAERIITNAVKTLHTLQQNYKSVLDEVDLAQQLEGAEQRKFEIGQSELFMLNQRELRTLQVKQKKLEYNFRILLNQLEIEKETGEMKIPEYTRKSS